MITIFLDPRDWDCAVDTSGNLAMATQEYQQAQDIASSCRVFIGDDYYNKNDGIPYLESIMGKSNYPLALYQRNLFDRSKLVVGVVSVDVNFNMLRDRALTGSIIFTNDEGFRGTVGL
jgi:hypothetical protein